MRRLSSVLTGLTLSLTLAGGTLAGTSVAVAADNPFERGPAPTVGSIEAARGPFAVSQVTVSRASVSGFGGGTIYFPTDTSQGTFGAISIAPGFTETQSVTAWIGPRVASQGFVVMTIDTQSTLDQPASRGQQLLASLDYLTQRSSVRTRIDASRLGVSGHSMGGGGTLAASSSRPSLQAAVPLAPWNTDKTWGEVRVPTFSNSPNTTMAKYLISWLKRFIDDDTRYEQFLCPAPRDSTISEYRDTCPHS